MCRGISSRDGPRSGLMAVGERCEVFCFFSFNICIPCSVLEADGGCLGGHLVQRRLMEVHSSDPVCWPTTRCRL